MLGELLRVSALPAGAAALAVLVWSATAAAQPPVPASAEPVRVRLEVYEDCPAAATFLGQLLGSTPHLRPAQPEELARTVDVSVIPRGGDSLGQLQVVLADGTEVSVTATGSCDYVLSVFVRLAARVLQPAAPSEASDGLEDLPENPYWRWLQALPAPEPLPHSPYWREVAGLPQEVPPDDNRCRRRPEAPPAAEQLPDNPYTRLLLAFPELPALPRNPYYRWLACRSVGNCWYAPPPNGQRERRGATPPPAPSDEEVERLSCNPYR